MLIKRKLAKLCEVTCKRLDVQEAFKANELPLPLSSIRERQNQQLLTSKLNKINRQIYKIFKVHLCFIVFLELFGGPVYHASTFFQARIF